MSSLEFKVVIIGSVAVGKTAITNWLQFQQFDEEYQATIGAGYIPYRTNCDGKDVELQIWDTAGMERYKSLGPIYYRDAVGCIIVYDQSSPESAEDVPKWIESFKATVKTPAHVIVAANKDDLPNKSVSNEQMKKWADDNNYEFFLTSAKSGKGINEMFAALVKAVMKLQKADSVSVKKAVTPPTNAAPHQECC